jgi:hypothetical protein
MKKTKEMLTLLALALSCFGCNGAPAIDVLGSFFPAWMICIIAAVALAFVVRYFLLKHRMESEVGPLAIFYPCVVVFFSCGLWLILFR